VVEEVAGLVAYCAPRLFARNDLQDSLIRKSIDQLLEIFDIGTEQKLTCFTLNYDITDIYETPVRIDAFAATFR